MLTPIIERLKPQLARRGALKFSESFPSAASDQMEEALTLISEEPVELGKFLASKFKAALSDVPDVFQDANVRLWLQLEETRDIVTKGARRALSGQDFSDQRASAATSFAGFTNGHEWWGEFVFDVAVAFVALSLKSKMSPGQLAQLEIIAGQGAETQEKIAELAARQKQPPDAVRALLIPLIEKEERFRLLVDPERIERLEKLCQRVESGDLQSAEPELAIKLYRASAAALARQKKLDEARHWINQARQLGANDLEPDEARLANAEKRFDDAIDLLKNRHDSLSIMLVAEALKARDGLENALAYVRKSIEPAELSGWALPTFASWLCEAGDWELGEALLASANPSQIAENPVLLYTRMRIRLTAMVQPEKHRAQFLQSDQSLPPPDALRNDDEGQRLRNAAINDCDELLKVIEDAFGEHENWLEAQRLYLVLSDPQHPEWEAAADSLRGFCLLQETAFLFGWLANSLGVDFDDTVFQKELARKELLGELSGPELQAALQWRQRKTDPASVAAFIEQNQEAFEASDLPKRFYVATWIESLAKAGETEQAREMLLARQSDLGVELAASLDAVLSEVESGEAAIEKWRQAYEQSGDPVDLGNLVDGMARVGHKELTQYAIEHWRKTHRIEMIIQCANVLFNAGRELELDELIDEIGESGDHVREIRVHRAWAYFRAGELDLAEKLTTELRDEAPDDSGLRQLAINIRIESGRWSSLKEVAYEDIERADARTAAQLLQGAALAQVNDDAVAIELARLAVAKAPDDPEVILAAYMAAVQAGTDWTSEAGGWLKRAIKHSDEEGPVRSAPLKDFIQMNREQEEQVAELNKLLLTGQMPLELLAQPLGITISELLLDRMQKNIAMRDARRRVCLPMVAGNRVISNLNKYECFAFDLSALLALETIGLLDTTLESLPTIWLASGTLPKLFEDFMRARRGQKSRYLQAQAVQRWIATSAISVVSPKVEADNDDYSELRLARQMDAQFVHSYPMFERGSLTEREMDVSEFKDLIISPTGLIGALLIQGEIDQATADAARSMLGDSRPEWPDEPSADLDGPLVVDNLALNALQSAGILDVLIQAGGKLMVSTATRGRIEAELFEWEELQKPLRSIERVRDKLVAASASGKVKHGGYRRQADDDDHTLANSQLMALLRDASGYDILVSGDRALNKTGQLTDQHGRAKPIVTIIDLIEFLRSTGAIDSKRRSRVRQRLRTTGVAFVPVEPEEIVAAASEGNWEKGPPKAFRALIDSIHLPLLREALVFPDEAHWIESIYSVFATAIQKIWRELPSPQAELSSSWLVWSLPDLTGYKSAEFEAELAEWVWRLRASFHLVITHALHAPAERLEDFEEWYLSVVLPMLGGRDLPIRSHIFDGLADLIGGVEPIKINESTTVSSREVASWMLGRLPRTVRDQIGPKDPIQKAFGMGEGRMRLGDRVVPTDELFKFICASIESSSYPLIDEQNAVIVESGRWDPEAGVLAGIGDKKVLLDFAGLIHPEQSVRTATFARLTKEFVLPVGTISDWQSRLDDGALTPAELREFHNALRDTPDTWLEDFRSKQGVLNTLDLQAIKNEYFASFLELGTTKELPDLLHDAAAAGEVQSDQLHAAFMLAPLASSPDFQSRHLVVGLKSDDILGLTKKLSIAGDPFSAVAAFDLVCANLNDARFVALGDEILEMYLGSEERLEKVAADFTALAKAVIGFADLNGTLALEKVEVRRCAFLAHAGLLSREFADLDVEQPGFLEMVEDWIGEPYRFMGHREAWDSRWWSRERLHPTVIAAYLRRRFKAIILAIGDKSCPNAWKGYVEIAEGQLPDIVELAAGPLDEFSPSWKTQAFPAKDLVSALEGQVGLRALNVLHNTLLAFEAPSDLEVANAAVLSVLDQIGSEFFAQAVDQALKAAIRWKSPDLAEKIVDRVFAKKEELQWAYRAYVELAFAASASCNDEEERDLMLDRLLHRVVFRSLDPNEAHELVRTLHKLGDAGVLSNALPPMQSSAILAS